MTFHPTMWTMLGSNPGKGKRIFPFPKFTDALEPYQPTIQWVPGSFPVGEAAGVWSSPFTSVQYRCLEWVELRFYSKISPWPGQRKLHLFYLFRYNMKAVALLTEFLCEEAKIIRNLCLLESCKSLRIKDQLDVTCYFISFLMCSTCFGH